MASAPFLIVFTPTYNRAHTLSRVYKSLTEQTDADFLWLIVDDGSTDDTAVLVAGWQAEGRMKIEYVHQENAGKHFAFNHALEIAESEMFMCLDSDDMLKPECVERLRYHRDRMRLQNSDSNAICFLLEKPDGGKWNEDFPKDEFDAYYAELILNGVLRDDTWIVYDTLAAKRYRYPERWRKIYFPDKFFPFAVSSCAKFRFVNERLGIYCWDPKDDERLSNFSRPENLDGGGAISLYLAYWVQLNFSERFLLKYTVHLFKKATYLNRFADLAGITLADRLRFLDSGGGRLFTLLSFIPGRLAAWLTRIRYRRVLK